MWASMILQAKLKANIRDTTAEALVFRSLHLTQKE